MCRALGSRPACILPRRRARHGSRTVREADQNRNCSMAVRIESNSEPIPGYRLIERIGSGGFGEVWKAEAPGGLFKAIKFVQREADADDSIVITNGESDRSRADQEWKSLMRVKSVRHPFILLLDRFENIDNYLVIVMELADRTLGDRFKECRTQGLPGIPREELLGYLAEAAE